MSDRGDLEHTPPDEARPGDAPPFPVNAAALGTGFLTVASLVLVLAWIGFTGDAGAPRPVSGTDPAAQASPSSAVASAERSGVNTRLGRCTKAVASLQGPLDAAQPALEQWAVHIKAMNQLVRGDITADQAVAFWNRTRAGAQDKVDAFHTADALLGEEGVDCPRPDVLAPGSRALPACARQVAAEVSVLRSARTSLDMWEHHVHQMDRLRLGEITAQRASRLWLRKWRSGQRDLADYREAVRAAQQASSCDTDAISQ